MLPACKRSPRSRKRYTPKTSSILTSKDTHGSYHTVKYGDSLWKISRDTGISIKDLASFNGINSSTPLKVGQKIYFPPKHYKNTHISRKYSKNTKITSSSIKSSRVFSWPAKGDIITKFGEKVNGITSKGIEISLDMLTPFKAAGDGEVIFSSTMKDYGIVTIVKHHGGYYTLYYSFNNKAIVKKGQKVKRGDILGYAGKKNLTDTHATLHFEIRMREKALNPIYLLKE